MATTGKERKRLEMECIYFKNYMGMLKLDLDTPVKIQIQFKTLQLKASFLEALSTAPGCGL